MQDSIGHGSPDSCYFNSRFFIFLVLKFMIFQNLDPQVFDVRFCDFQGLGCSVHDCSTSGFSNSQFSNFLAHVRMFALPPQDEAIADALAQGLDIALGANHAQRTVEPSASFLHHAGPMNETECLGSLENIVNNSTVSLVARDVALLEWIRHISRHMPYHLISSHTIPCRII